VSAGLVVDRVARSFGSVQAVRDVSFGVRGGATFGLLGPNGAGKTTTMRMILGIIAPSSGTISWRGAPIDARTRKRLGYLPEERGLYGKLSVRDQIAYFARLHGVAENEVARRVAGILDEIELAADAGRPCAELSKGNQQKVQFACAAVHDPELLILDEPFSGLDPVNAQILLRAMRALQQRGATLILSSHQMWQLEGLCTEYCIIAGGEGRAHGTLAELRALRPAFTLRAGPASEALRAAFARVPGAVALPSHDGYLDYRVPRTLPLEPLVRALVAAAPLTHFECIEPSLAEIYLEAIGAAA
jgi:ABC-2 type transport system ATP-binding protein